MTQSKEHKSEKSSFLKKAKREVTKLALVFTAGAITSAVAILNQRRQKRLKEKYKSQLKSAENKD